MASSNKRRTANQSSATSGSDESDEDNGALGFASRVAGKTKDVVKERVGEKVGESVSGLHALAKTLRLASQQLEGNVGGPALERVGDGVERVAKFIEDADARDLLRRAESFGRESPLLFIGAAAGIGFVGGRFLRASAQPRSSTAEQARGRKDQPKESPRLPPPRGVNGSSRASGERRV